MKLSSKLRLVGSETHKGIMHWCPGCKEPHVIWTQRPDGHVWSWNGNIEKPTTHPSVRCYTMFDDDGETKLKQQRTLCHYFLREGVIEFCADCPHEFAGKHVPLPDLPEGLNE